MLIWLEVDPAKANGVILSYEVRYQKADGEDSQQTRISNNQTMLVSGLEGYRVYKLSIAAVNRKGTGIFSSVVQERTLEDGKQKQ